MQKSQNQAIYQASTIWFYGKDIRKKRIPGSQPRRYNIFKSCLASFITTIPTSRQQRLLLLIPPPSWQNQQSSSLQSGNEGDQQKDVLWNASNEVTKKISELPEICFPGIESIGEPVSSEHAGSSTPLKTEQYFIPTKSLFSPYTFSFPRIFSHQVREVFH